MLKFKIILSLCFSAILLTGCISIPAEAPELSTELGKRISAIETSNVALLNKFFDHKRAEVDRFIQQEWVPTFAEDFFTDTRMSKAWDTIVEEDNKQQRLTFIVKVGTKLQDLINSKRLELIQPLDDLERLIENNIRSEYAQARAINNSITSFLFSASDVAENRNRYLDMVGADSVKVNKLLDETDLAVSKLLKSSKKTEDKLGDAQKYIDKLRKIRESI